MSTVPTYGPMVRVDASGLTRTSANTSSVPPMRPGAIVREETAFYDLSRWSKYNDLLLVVGFLVLCVAVAFIWRPYTVPIAFVVLGAGIMKLAWMMGQGK